MATIGVRLFEQGKMDEAYEHLKEEAKHEHPPGEAALCLAAAMALRQGDRELIELGEQLVAPTLPRDMVLQVVGAVLYDLGFDDEGLQRMQEAMRLRRSWENIVPYVARIDEKPEYQEEALKLYRELLARDESDQFALLGLGMMFLRMQRVGEAEEPLKKALLQDPGDPTAQCQYGNLLCDKGEYDRAPQHYLAALAHDYWKPEWCWGNLAFCYLKSGQLEKAAAAADKAIELEPGREDRKQMREKIKSAQREQRGQD